MDGAKKSGARSRKLPLIFAVATFLAATAYGTYASWNAGWSSSTDYLQDLNGRILHRSDATRRQIEAGFVTLGHAVGTSSCTDEALTQMAMAAAASSYLAGFARIEGETLLCSTLPGARIALALGPASEDPEGRVWSGVELPGIPDQKFVLYERGGIAAILSDSLVLDILNLNQGVTLAQFRRDDRSVFRARGAVPPAWLDHYAGVATSFTDGAYLVAFAPSGQTDVVSLAAMPVGIVHGAILDAAIWRVPLGMVAGVILALLVFFVLNEQASLRNELRRALIRKEFYLLYQPVLDLRDGRCVGAEALIRWRRRDGQFISPLVFIQAAEEHGLIEDITAEVLRLIARDATEFLKENPQAHIAINFSADDIHSAGSNARLQQLISATGATSSNIVIEATERDLMSPDRAKPSLSAFRGLGFRVAVDDFGTGNSSLSYLSTYEFDFLKIDKSFVDALGQDRILQHITEMAKSLRLQMIAEGVETEEQRDTLRALGVQFAQGWLFAKPISMPDLRRFFRERNLAFQ